MPEQPQVVVCIATAWVSESQMVTEGKLYRADDLVVRENPGLFTEDLNSLMASPPRIQAVQTPPDIKRAPGRPPKNFNE